MTQTQKTTCLPLFEGREWGLAVSGFLLGLSAPVAMLLSFNHVFDNYTPGPGTYIIEGPLLVLGITWGIIVIASFFWSLALLSNSRTRQERLAPWCGWLWVAAVVLGMGHALLLHRQNGIGSILLLIFLAFFFPRASHSTQLSFQETWLSRWEHVPVLWGFWVGLGTLALRGALNSMDPHLSSTVTGYALSSVIVVAEGFILGILLLTWSRQRWPGLLIAALNPLLVVMLWYLKHRGLLATFKLDLVGLALVPGILLGDIAVSKVDQSQFEAPLEA